VGHRKAVIDHTENAVGHIKTVDNQAENAAEHIKEAVGHTKNAVDLVFTAPGQWLASFLRKAAFFRRCFPASGRWEGISKWMIPFSARQAMLSVRMVSASGSPLFGFSLKCKQARRPERQLNSPPALPARAIP